MYAPGKNDVLVLSRLTSGNERSARRISRLRPSDNGAKRYQNSAALLIFMRRTAIPNFSFLIPNS